MSRAKLRNLTVFSIAGAAFFGFVLRVTPCMEGFLIAAAFWGLIWLIVAYAQRQPVAPVKTVKAIPKSNPVRTTVQSTINTNTRNSAAPSKRIPTNTAAVAKPAQPKVLPAMPPKTSKGSSRLFVPPPLD